MTDSTTTPTRPHYVETEVDSTYGQLLDALEAAGVDHDLVVRLDEAVGARLVQAEDEVIKTSIESQVAALRSELAKLRLEMGHLRAEINHRALELGDDLLYYQRQLATEVRTRRVVVVNEEGFEGVVAEAGNGLASVKVTSQEDPSVWTSIHANDQSGVSSGLYLSGGDNGAGSFEVLGEVYDVDVPEAIEYSASLDITPDSMDPRFHGVSLDREGLHFGG